MQPWNWNELEKEDKWQSQEYYKPLPVIFKGLLNRRIRRPNFNQRRSPPVTKPHKRDEKKGNEKWV